MILWMLEDLDNGKGDLLPRERAEPQWLRERSRKIWCKVIRTSERAEDSWSVLELLENRSSIEGLLRKATAATESTTIEFPEKENDLKGKSGKGGGKKGKSKDAGALVWIQQTGSPVSSGGVVCTADGNKLNGWFN